MKVSHYTLVTALGAGIKANWAAIDNNASGLKPCNFSGAEQLKTWIGEVQGFDKVSYPARLSNYECRNNSIALYTLQQDGFLDKARELVDKYGSHRVGLFIGTSTSGIRETEKAYCQISESVCELPNWYHYQETHNIFSPADFVYKCLDLSGICVSISTACSSSAKVFASAERAISSGLCDAAIVGGVDSLCLTTLFGFNALQVVSDSICRPSDERRSGINIGEAGGFAILESHDDKGGVDLLGYGESSDAYHMSTPHPEGKGAVIAMQEALSKAMIEAEQVQYINLHGTGTGANDLSESAAVVNLFGSSVPCSSTKGWTGHTLGAAGIVEAILCIQALENEVLPGSLNTEQVDPAIHANILLKNEKRPFDIALSNSFGFGGSNCSLVFGKV